MPNVQQPEMRRSEDDPLVQDNAKAKAEAEGVAPREEDKQRRGRKPKEQRSPYPS